MNKELNKRVITSLFLITLLSLTFFYSYILIISLLIISAISWIEFNSLIIKIFKKKNLQTLSSIAGFKLLSLLYLFIFSLFVFDGVFDGMKQIEPSSKLNIIYE